MILAGVPVRVHGLWMHVSLCLRVIGASVCLCRQPPVGFPPAGILPFLNLEAIQDTGYRLAMISRDDCSFMGPACVSAKVRGILNPPLFVM